MVEKIINLLIVCNETSHDFNRQNSSMLCVGVSKFSPLFLGEMP